MAPLPLRTGLRAIPDGPDGIAGTLSSMVAITRAWIASPLIHGLARTIRAGLRERDYAAEAEAVHNFVRDRVPYVLDPDGLETLQTPEVTLALGGDCDDKAMLAAALYKSLGKPARFVAGGFDGGDFEHVWVEVKIGPAWYGSDTTEAHAFGWRPPRSTIRQIAWV